ncbi:rRNA-processing protein [Orobanche hederae]
MNELWYTFNTVCSDKYINLMNKVKVSGKKPDWMEQPEYEAWLAYWHRTDVEDVSYKNSQNRLSVPVDGKGVAKHHFGSEAVVTARVRALDKGEDKSLFDFFKRAKLNAKEAYVDKKSEDIAVSCGGVGIVDQDLTVEAINKIFLEVNPPDDKGFIYGLGSLGVALSALASSSSHGSRSSRLSEERLREELAKKDAECLNLQEEQRLLAKQMQKDKDEMADRFAAQQQQVEEIFRHMEAMRGSQPPSFDTFLFLLFYL